MRLASQLLNGAEMSADRCFDDWTEWYGTEWYGLVTKEQLALRLQSLREIADLR
jgi:hypothetical protein